MIDHKEALITLIMKIVSETYAFMENMYKDEIIQESPIMLRVIVGRVTTAYHMLKPLMGFIEKELPYIYTKVEGLKAIHDEIWSKFEKHINESDMTQKEKDIILK